jgi:hypothetical protein
MKGQSSLLILLAIMAIMMGGWIFTSFSQVRIQENNVMKIMLTKIGEYLDVIKGFSRNALILATNEGTFAVGGEGITFYCNNPTPPTTRQMRYELSSQTINLLNEYLKNYPASEPLMTIDIQNFSCVDNPVEGLEQGLIDKNFTANAYGSKIGISIKENNVSTNNELFEIIPEDRFWFLYRELRDWSYQKGKNFEGLVCNCLTTSRLPKWDKVMENCNEWPEFDECFKTAIDNTAKDMENFIGDPNIECSGEPSCCYGEKEPCQTTQMDDQCGVWGGGTGCSNCTTLPDKELCIEKIGASSEKNQKGYEKIKDMISFEGKDEEQRTSKISFASDGICSPDQCKFYETGYINVKAQFTCTDKKYQLSLPFPEDRYLKFTIDTKVSLMRRGINVQPVDCVWEGPDCKCEGQFGVDYCEGKCVTVGVTSIAVTTTIATPITVPKPPT